jgi:hypothetical protein
MRRGVPNSVRLVELGFLAGTGGEDSRSGIVIHTEGLINGKVRSALLRLGRELRGTRPTLATITPLCPMYTKDPELDRLRLDFEAPSSTEEEKDLFLGYLEELSAFYDIGYHGHFFRETQGRFRPCFDAPVVETQFRSECEFLSRNGYKPIVYAGGWWHIDHAILSLLRECGFRADTTINDIGKDSFHFSQPFRHPKLGEPFWISGGLVEIPTTRTIRTVLQRAIRSEPHGRRFNVFSFHDYDLANLGNAGVVLKTVAKLIRRGNVVGMNELVEESMTFCGMTNPLCGRFCPSSS